MKSTYITFGQEHKHIIQGITFDRNCVALIDNGRETAFLLFGDKWAFEYKDKPDMNFFPRGIIEIKLEIIYA